jgi:hypothetical protein
MSAAEAFPAIFIKEIRACPRLCHSANRNKQQRKRNGEQTWQESKAHNVANYNRHYNAIPV